LDGVTSLFAAVAALSAGYPSLEDAYVHLTDDAVEYRAA